MESASVNQLIFKIVPTPDLFSKIHTGRFRHGGRLLAMNSKLPWL